MNLFPNPFEYTDAELSTEIWKPVPEYEDLYEFSTLGRLRSCDRSATRIYKDGRSCDMTVVGKIYSPTFAANHQSVTYLMRKDGKNTTRSANSLMLRMFPEIINDQTSVYSQHHLPDVENLDGEIWKKLEITKSNIYVSNMGRVKRGLTVVETSSAGYKARTSQVFRPKLLAPVKYAGTKAVYVKIGEPGERSYIYKRLDELVASKFLEPRPANSVLRHKDGDSNNCEAENLFWKIR